MERLVLHGHDVAYHRAGEGPVVVLVHGITGRASTWDAVAAELVAAGRTVIAPDLLGHGESAKPRGDYSLGAHAAGIRDLLAALGHERVTIAGHSFGGGIAMQFAYQFPERVERLILVSSGGLGRELSPFLRAAALPGAELVLPLLSLRPVREAGQLAQRALAPTGIRPGPGLVESLRSVSSLADGDARAAFLHTLRSVVDVGGQRVDARDRLYLASHIPTLILWGTRDRIIPVEHGVRAARLIPDSRLELIERAGHFPHVEQPASFVDVVLDFLATTAPAAILPEGWTARLRDAAAG